MVTGAQLRVGDIMAVWWKPRHDKITKLRPYEGSLTVFPQGASIATFERNTVGMTIEHHLMYELLNRE